MLRVLREWVLARSAPASPLARACALHLLCRDAGFLHFARMMIVSWVCDRWFYLKVCECVAHAR